MLSTNIHLVGTTHLMNKEEIEAIIEREKPEVIGVELCELRLQLMVLSQTPPPAPTQPDESIMGRISAAIHKKAQEAKVQYGSDMIAAAKYAIEKKVPLVLVDRDLRETNELMNKIPANEQLGFMSEIAKFQEMSLQQIDQETRANNEDKLLQEMKAKYPIAYEFLIGSREVIITNNILKAIIRHPGKKILVFLGKGHVKTMQERLQI